ncbi:DUF6264 family protein [Pseudolysinimonas sp.]|uniref:DUF6264 family protein n=1 Tax=Pseudolysinimonas sp. TaxID=2680009 RepID=UPI00286D01DD|nr:DUF6264 family protein [Pseudolysinimonas sp.]
MSDPRPRPQYGEYATPEEVAALRGVPLETPASTTPPPPTGPPAAPRSASRVAAPAKGWRRLDRPITIALVLFGLVNVIQSAPLFIDFVPTLELAAKSVTYGPVDLSTLEFGEAARVGGYVLFAISIVLLVAAAGFSYLALSRSRVAFWIPLTAGALNLVCYVVVLGVVLYSTPGFLSAI